MEILRGWIRCSLQTMFTHTDNYPGGGFKTVTYNDQQVLQWSWTNTPALVASGTNQYFSVSWSAQGSGSQQVHTASATGNSTQDDPDSWTTNCVTMLPLGVRQANGVVTLSSQETYPPNGCILFKSQFIDGVQQGMPTRYTPAATALAVSITWGSDAGSVSQFKNAHITVASTSSKEIGSRLGEPLFVSRIGAAVIRGTRQDTFMPPKGPDAPLSIGTTIANWTWEIATQA